MTSDPDSTTTETLVINEQVRIPLAELHFQFTRSSGAGGQHVNKNETAVELAFDVARSSSLTDTERARVLAKLRGRITSDGILKVESQGSRSQLKNREEVTRKFAQLLREALVVPRTRRKTRPSRGAIESRLEGKKHRSSVKRERRSSYD
jgi:ribosome-associated protein